MNTFEAYLSGLPRPESESEKSILRRGEIPFIDTDTIVDKLHEPCGTETPTRVLSVYVPNGHVTVPVEYAHHGSPNPLKACKAALAVTTDLYVGRMEARGIHATVIDAFIDAYSREARPLGREMTPEERLLEAARVYKMALEDQPDFKRFLEITMALTR